MADANGADLSALGRWYGQSGTPVVRASGSYDADNRTYTLKLAETWPPNFPVFGDTTQNFKAMVEKMSDGRLQITKYLLNGMLAFDDPLTYCLYSCLQCRRCERMCHSKGQAIDICALIQAGRELLSARLAEGGSHAAL